MIPQHLRSILLVLLCFAWPAQALAQSAARDSAFHPYRVNGWVSGPLLAAGIGANLLGLSQMMHKAQISREELAALDKNVIHSFDRWALKQDPALIEQQGTYADATLATGVVLPFLLLFDGQIRRDWLPVLVMYLETMSLSPNIYEWSFMGPAFQNRLRPVAYYEQLTWEERNSGANRNSFYSGHVATVAASTFFMVKVYSDYHPGLGYAKYLLYTAATLPPMLLGYFRIKGLKHFASDVFVGIGIGALCGILVPELHRLRDRGLDVGMFASPEGTGVRVAWKPEW